jgi:hypothetical protein
MIAVGSSAMGIPCYPPLPMQAILFKGELYIGIAVGLSSPKIA